MIEYNIKNEIKRLRNIAQTEKMTQNIVAMEDMSVLVDEIIDTLYPNNRFRLSKGDEYEAYLKLVQDISQEIRGEIPENYLQKI